VKNNTGPSVYTDNSNVNDEDPCDKILVRINRIKKRIEELWNEYNKLIGLSDDKSFQRRTEITDIISKHEETIKRLNKLYDDCLDKDVF
jgi:hypothetical protein